MSETTATPRPIPPDARLLRVPHTPAAGMALATVTACVSGVAVFLNGYGVRRVPDATTYTTAKNLVAAVLLGGLLLATRTAHGAEPADPAGPRPDRRRWFGLVAVAVVGGSVPFVLFFEGLARASSTDAAFLHKTLVVWVAVLAVPLLRERVGRLHLLAIALLVGGQALLTGDLGALRPGSGETMVLAATLLWSAEVVVAKRMLDRGVASTTLGVARMGGGVAVLVGWAAVRGELSALVGLGAAGWLWAVATGALLFAYVATWFAALARAQAVDVTAVLVFGAVITAGLDRVVEGAALADPLGLGLLAAGTACALLAAQRIGAPASTAATALP